VFWLSVATLSEVMTTWTRRVPRGTAAVAERRRKLVTLPRSAAVTGPICIDASGARAGPKKLATTAMLSAMVPDPPRSAARVALTRPASISGPAAAMSMSWDAVAAPIVKVAGPPAKNALPPPVSVGVSQKVSA
jgi:hypothetical protein